MAPMALNVDKSDKSDIVGSVDFEALYDEQKGLFIMERDDLHLVLSMLTHQSLLTRGTVLRIDNLIYDLGSCSSLLIDGGINDFDMSNWSLCQRDTPKKSRQDLSISLVQASTNSNTSRSIV